jgi:hypothetical protein
LSNAGYVQAEIIGSFDADNGAELLAPRGQLQEGSMISVRIV